MRKVHGFALACITLCALAFTSIGAAVAAAFHAIVPRFIDAKPHFRFLDSTPRSVLESRRLGLA